MDWMPRKKKTLAPLWKAKWKKEIASERGHSLRWGGGGQVCSAPSPGLLEAIWKVLGLLLITWKTKQSRHLAVWEMDDRRDSLVARFLCVCVCIMLVINPVSLFLFTSDGPHPRFRRHVRQMSERGRKG